MSVPKDKRGHGQLEVNAAALDLCTYTMIITANEKTFTKAQMEFTTKLRDTALEIHLLCWEANNIKVDGNTDRYLRRIELQQIAADHCNRMCALIEVAKPLFHLSSKRCIYWIQKAVTLRAMIRAWSASDFKRLKPA